MLRITVPDTEYFDEAHDAFITIKGQVLQMEHSLVSLSKWESKWHKPFLGKDPKTEEETIDYFRCMTITQNVNPLVYYAITPQMRQQINAYLEDSMTATWFSGDKGPKGSRDIITAEVIYYWMISLQIPFECEKWHLNRLLTLIRVCNEKNNPNKKMSRKETLAQYRALNMSRRSRMNTKG